MKKNIFILLFMFSCLSAQTITVNNINDNAQDKKIKIKISKKNRQKISAAISTVGEVFVAIATQVLHNAAQQAVNNLVASVLTKADQIVQIEENYSKSPELLQTKIQAINSVMEEFVEIVYMLITSENDKLIIEDRFVVLNQLKNLKTKKERLDWLSEKILDNTFVQLFLSEALNYIDAYLHKLVDELMNNLREILLVKDLNENIKK